MAPFGELYNSLKLRIPGDVMIGAMFPVHEQPTVRTAFSRRCGRIREQYGIQRIEMLIQSLNKINQNPNILPGIKLGVDVRDTCWFEPIALEQCMDFIRTAFMYKEYEDCMQANNYSNYICAPPGTSDFFVEKPIAALIGPGSSEMTKQVQQVLQIFAIPQIGYSATAASLSDVMEYGTFIRVVPSDALQVKVIASILRFFKWTYVILVNSKGLYGEKGILALKEEMQLRGICAENEFSIDNKQTHSAFIQLARQLFNPSNKAKVVVCFCQGETVGGIFRAMTDLRLTGKGYMVIGSDGWADRTDILGPVIDENSGERYASAAAQGSLSIRIRSKHLPEFDEYFMNLTPKQNTWNPWFKAFWEQKFDCSLNASIHSTRKPCSDNLTLRSPTFEQDNKLGLLNTSIYTLAMALHSVHAIVCGEGFFGVCDEFLPIDGDLLRSEILATRLYDSNGDLVYFDRNGDPPGSYEILNYQRILLDNRTETYSYKQIGWWRSGEVLIEPTNAQWPRTIITKVDQNGTEEEVISYTTLTISRCSEPCAVGEIKVVKQRPKSCCWICKPCLPNERVVSSDLCEKCPLGYKPTENRTECTKIQPIYPHWSRPLPLISILLASFGVLLTVFGLTVFLFYQNTSIVKASTRELMYVMLIGMLFAHASNFVVIWQPTVTSCLLSRVFPGLAFSMLYGALATKTNRIARILEGSKRIYLKKQRFLSLTAQLVITALINVAELTVIAVMLFMEPPGPKLLYFNSDTMARLICNTTRNGTVVPLAMGIVLIVVCTCYAIKTRNLPHNFNEAKFIGFTMYTTCVLWLATLPIYLGGYETEFALTMAVSLSATIAFIILFIPKIYIMLFHPEKNSRRAFVTAKDIRCHIGVLQANISQKSKKGPRTKESNARSDFTSLETENSVPKEPTTPQKVNLFRKNPRPAKTKKPPNKRESTPFDDAASQTSMQVPLAEPKARVLSRRVNHIWLPKNPTSSKKHDASAQTRWSLLPSINAGDPTMAESEDDYSSDFHLDSIFE
ncbi:hypothetical protein AAHC03_016535 [Spirometra sp. Aus1]